MPGSKRSRSAPVPTVRYCTCGKCHRCREVAKWVSRFEARFGESMRAYYQPLRLMPRRSPFADL